MSIDYSRASYKDLLQTAKYSQRFKQNKKMTDIKPLKRKPLKHQKGQGNNKKKNKKNNKKQQQKERKVNRKNKKNRQPLDFVPCFKKYISCYHILADTPKKYSKHMKNAVIRKMTRKQMHGLWQPVEDILRDVIKFPNKKHKDALFRKAKQLRAFNNTRNLRVAKRILTQKGGFLRVLIPILRTLITSVATHGIESLFHKRH